MFKKVNNNQLIIVFVVLLVIVGILTLTDTGKKERSFRKELVEIDTSAVTKINIFPKSKNHKEVSLFKEGSNWKVKLYSGKEVSVPKRKVENLFSTLMGIKPKSLVSRDKAKWKDFQVDTTGTRVEVFEGSSKTLDLIVGRFTFQQPRSMFTYVRLAEENDVYETEGFIGPSMDQGPDYFRDGTVLNGKMSDWTMLAFTMPGDSSYALKLQGDKWTCNNAIVDSAKTVNFIRNLEHLSHTYFAEDSLKSLLDTPTHQLIITTKDEKKIVLRRFKDKEHDILSSSANNEAVFDLSKGSLAKRIFKSYKDLKK